MVNNPYAKYKENSINTATGPELTLMLYNGAIKFCNIAVESIKEKEVQKAHDSLIRVQDIILELRTTLNKKYPIASEMDQLYEYIYDTLVEANLKKDIGKVEEVCQLVRNYRDAWQEAIKISRMK